MEQAIIDQTIKALERNHFEVYFANNRQEARDIFFQEIFDKIKPTTISWGDSETMKATGILSEIEQRPECILIRTFQDGYSRAQKTYWRRQALLADLFVTGTNALTRQGQLVNVDMVTRRHHLQAGTRHSVHRYQQITDDIEQAERIRTIAAPLSAIRHPHLHTPCQTTRTCMNCQSVTAVTRDHHGKSLPKNESKLSLSTNH
ncbi:MAG: LUD domain-containing protein [Butyricimonas faecihominis]